MAKINRLERARLKRIAEGRAREGDSHSVKFWNNKFRELKRYAREKGIDFPFGSKREFISDWTALSQELSDGKGEVMREMKYGLQYATKYKVARAERQALREINQARINDIESDFERGIINADTRRDMLREIRQNTPTFNELKSMTTREFAESHKDEIMARYNQLRKSGMEPGQAGDVISSEWFGSE